MPDQKEYIKKHDQYFDTMSAFNRRKDMAGLVGYMKQIISENVVGNGGDEGFEEGTNPAYDAVKTFMKVIIMDALENGEKEKQFIRDFIYEIYEQNGETAYNVMDKFMDTETSIVNGEAEEYDCFADAEADRTVIVASLLGINSKYSKIVDPGIAIVAMFNNALNDTEHAGPVERYVLDTLNGAADENGNITVEPAKRKTLDRLSGKGLSDKMVDKLRVVVDKQVGFDIGSFSVAPVADVNGKPVVRYSEAVNTRKDLTDEQLENMKQDREKKISDYRKEHTAEEEQRSTVMKTCKYEIKSIECEQERRRLQKADPESMKIIELKTDDLRDLTEMQDKLDVFRLKIKQIVDTAQPTCARLSADRAERGHLDPKKHAQYIKMCDLADDLYTLDHSMSPKEIIKTLKDMQQAAQEYYDSHYKYFYKREAGRNRIYDSVAIKESIACSIESLEKLSDEISPYFVDDMSVEDCLNDINKKKKEIREEIASRKEKVREKAARIGAEKVKADVRPSVTAVSESIEIDLDTAVVPDVPEEEAPVEEAPMIAEEPEPTEKTADEFIADAQDVVKFAMTQVKNKGQYPDKDALSKQYAQIVTAYYLKSQMKDKNDKIDTEVFSKQVDVVYHSNDFKETLRRNSAKTLYEQASADHAQDVYQNFVNVHAARKQEKAAAAKSAQPQPQAAKEIKAPNNNPVKK
ncbi:hypothetical protein SAMN02910317_03003 [Ruminococcaceae bacterium FB2012]|nr:hypothetical protein SAMN02910317_03003 [Ruminococcaceae bacterium FB2012]